MDSQENLRETDDRDPSPANADEVDENATPAAAGQAGARPAAEHRPCDERDWICIWPPDPGTIKRFRSAATASLDT